ELTDILFDLIDVTDEQKRKKILQFACGLLNSEHKANIKLAFKLSQKIRSALAESKLHDPQLLQMLLLCAKSWNKHVWKDKKSTLRQMCCCTISETSSAQSVAGQKVIRLFDNFVSDLKVVSIFTPQLHAQIEQHLKSTMLKQRLAGNHLLDKLLDSSFKDFDQREVDHFSEFDFTSLITIVQCLQVEQTPSASKDDKCGLNWMRPLYISLLGHDDLLLLRWTLEYLMLHTTSSDLRQANILEEFLKASNWLELHDLEEHSLPLQQMIKFVPSIEMKRFFTAFVKVPWLDIALARWLDSLRGKRVPQVTQDLLYEMVQLVKNMKNQELRFWAGETLFTNFRNSIQSLSLVDYMTLVKTLYENTELAPFVVEFYFQNMIRECKALSEQFVQLNIEGFELITNRWKYQPHSTSSPYFKLFQQLQNVPKSCHGWWRLPLLFMFNKEPEVLNWYHAEYDLSIELTNLKELQQHLLEKFNCKAQDEKLYVLQRSVDLFVETNLSDWSKLQELHLDPIDLLEQGTVHTCLHLANILCEQQQCVEQSSKILAAIVQKWRKYTPYDYLRCIEFALEKQFDLSNSCICRRNLFIEYAYRQSREDLYELFNKLIRINVSMNRNGLILENSKESRAQLRILRVLLHSDAKSKAFWTNHLWQLLLCSATQPNQICVLYECLLAQQLPVDEPHFEQLLERVAQISSLESTQQDSLISVLLIYCIRNADLLKMEQFQTIFELLNQQMSELHSHTQTFAQLVLHKLAKKCEEKSIAFPMAVELQMPANIVVAEKIAQTVIEVRLMLPEILENLGPADILLHIINAPIDEYRKLVWVEAPLPLYNKLRKAFASRNEL
ncbi:hypothetical protein KR093_003616, partial [Drosophila rubida]